MDSKVKIWDLKQGKLGYTLYGHQGSVGSCCFSKAGDYFATGGVDTMIMLWKSNFIDSGIERYEEEKRGVKNTEKSK